MSNSYQDHFKKIKKEASKKTAASAPNSKGGSKTRSLNKNKSQFSFKAIFICLLGVSICVGALYFDEEATLFAKSLKVGFFETAKAIDPPTPTETLDSEQEPVDQSQLVAQASPSDSEQVPSGDLGHLRTLIQRDRELKLREQELLKLEKEIEQKNAEIDKRIQELEKIRTDIAEKLKSQVESDSKKIDQLVEVYSVMRPAQAAKVLEDLEEDLAVQVLGKMKKKNAADILNLMNVEKAKKFTEMYTGHRRPASE